MGIFTFLHPGAGSRYARDAADRRARTLRRTAHALYRFRWLLIPPSRRLAAATAATAVVCLLWGAVVVGRWWDVSSGDDMACHYLAARLLNEGDSHDLYAYNAKWFNRVSNPAWEKAAVESGVLRQFQDVSQPSDPKEKRSPQQRRKEIEDSLHPYVQIPLLPFLLRPAAGRMRFGTFNHVSFLLMVLATLVFVWISALLWDRRLLAPVPLAAAAVVKVTPAVVARPPGSWGPQSVFSP